VLGLLLANILRRADFRQLGAPSFLPRPVMKFDANAKSQITPGAHCDSSLLHCIPVQLYSSRLALDFIHHTLRLRTNLRSTKRSTSLPETDLPRGICQWGVGTFTVSPLGSVYPALVHKSLRSLVQVRSCVIFQASSARRCFKHPGTRLYDGPSYRICNTRAFFSWKKTAGLCKIVLCHCGIVSPTIRPHGA
jgi:hypothetical protein